MAIWLGALVGSGRGWVPANESNDCNATAACCGCGIPCTRTAQAQGDLGGGAGGDERGGAGVQGQLGEGADREGNMGSLLLGLGSVRAVRLLHKRNDVKCQWRAVSKCAEMPSWGWRGGGGPETTWQFLVLGPHAG